MSNSHLIILHLLDVIACLRSESRRGIILTAQNEMQNKVEIRVSVCYFVGALKIFLYNGILSNGRGGRVK